VTTIADRPWTFYFDFISPYAFLGWTQIRPLAAKHGRSVEPRPILFAGLLEFHGTKGPAEIPAKRTYLGKDVARKAHRYGVLGIRPPPAHPFHPLASLRAVCAPLDAETRERAIDALFYAVWTKGRAIDTPEAVEAVLTEAGLDGAGIVIAAQAADVKAQLRKNTELAIARGVFGVPTVDADGELFWGTDSLDDLELHARGERPATDFDMSTLPIGVARRV
jgi:2-hydroxychromene-2-carboxylate isomerase